MADNCLLEVLFCLVSGIPYCSGFPPTNSCYWRFLAYFSSLHPLYYWDYPGLSHWSTALSFFGSMHFQDFSLSPPVLYKHEKSVTPKIYILTPLSLLSRHTTRPLSPISFAINYGHMTIWLSSSQWNVSRSGKSHFQTWLWNVSIHSHSCIFYWFEIDGFGNLRNQN